MKCPYCNNVMTKGIISGDGRSPVTWKEGNKKANFLDKLGGGVMLKLSKKTISTFEIESFYCNKCHIMMFETEIE